MRCVGTIYFVSCKDLNSVHAKIEALYQQSIKNDNPLTFVSVNRSYGSEELSIKALSHAFIVKTVTCLQLFAAVYSTITGRLKVILLTRSVFTSVLDSDYFIYEYDIPNDNSNTARLERIEVFRFSNIDSSSWRIFVIRLSLWANLITDKFRKEKSILSY